MPFFANGQAGHHFDIGPFLLGSLTYYYVNYANFCSAICVFKQLFSAKYFAKAFQTRTEYCTQISLRCRIHGNCCYETCLIQ